MAYLLPHLHNGWEVDQAILNEEDRVVVIRWGRDTDSSCMIQDEVRFTRVCVALVITDTSTVLLNPATTELFLVFDLDGSISPSFLVLNI